MNIYKVTILGEEWDVPASTVASAIRKGLNVENADRLENNWFRLDREIVDNAIEITVELLFRGLTQEEVDDYFKENEAESG